MFNFICQDDSGSEESGDSDDEDEDDDYYDDDGEVDLKHLAEQLPDDIKRKVLGRKKLKSGNRISDDEEEEDDDEDDEDGAAASWGRKKQTYWSGDTADLEIGQEMEDAEEEEAAAQVNHKKLTILFVVHGLVYYIQCSTYSTGFSFS